MDNRWCRYHWCYALVAWLLMGCSHGWTRADTARQLVSSGLQAVDWAQTRYIANDPYHTEANPILGAHPTIAEVNRYFIITMIGNIAVAYALPPKYRKWWQYGGIGLSGAVVIHNHRNGVGVD